MNRPTPRRSALSAHSVIAPTETPATPQAPKPMNAGNASTASQASVAVNAGTPGTASLSGVQRQAQGGDGDFEKITIRIPRELAEQARAAFWHTSATRGIRSFGAWIALAVQGQLEVDQEQFNGGEAFPHIPTGHIPVGRR